MGATQGVTRIRSYIKLKQCCNKDVTWVQHRVLQECHKGETMSVA